MKERTELVFFPEEGRIDRRFIASGRYRRDVGHVHNGYKLLQIQGGLRAVHRLIWEHINGPIPVGFFVDHINHNTVDNRIENLRLVTRKQNLENQAGPRIDNRSGYRGVYYNKANRNWRAGIGHDGRNIYLGSFASAEDAYAAYCKAAESLHTHNPAPAALCGDL